MSPKEIFAEPYTGGAAAQTEVRETLIPTLLKEFDRRGGGAGDAL